MDELKRGWQFALEMNGVHNETERKITEISEKYEIPFHKVMKWYIKQLQEEHNGKDE